MYNEESIKLWNESQEILIKELKQRSKSIKESIEIQTLALENNERMLKHEKKQLKQFNKNNG